MDRAQAPADENNSDEQNRSPLRERSRRELILEFRSDVKKLLESYEEFAVVPNVDDRLLEEQRRLEEMDEQDNDNAVVPTGPEDKQPSTHNNKVYNCKRCKIQFTNLKDLKAHKRTHNSERPYSRN